MNTKKTISIILTIVGVVCLLVAGFLLFRQSVAERENDAMMEALRASAESLEAANKELAQDRNSDTSSAKNQVASENSPVNGPEASNGVNETASAVTSQAGETHSGTDGSSDTPTDTSKPSSGTSAETDKPGGNSDDSNPGTDTQASTPAVPNPYKDSYLANEDMVAWLQIPDTKIDYPVMWTPEDENYYLYRDFDGSDNQNGCLILDTDSSLDPLTTNLIIHGHNMRSGAMFGNLTDYESQDYYEKHKNIILYTEECQRNYEVIAVFRSQVFKKSDQVFKFYKFFQADTQEEFDDFYNNIKEMSLYDTGVTAELGDHFITLSTCVYHVTNGRFVVIAKEVENGDTYLPVRD